MSTSKKNVIFVTTNPLEDLDREDILNKAKEMLISYLIRMSSLGITVVWVWDGKCPEEKYICHEKRKNVKDRIISRIEESKKKLTESHQLARTPEAINEYRKLICQHNTVSQSEMVFFKNLIELLGFPSIDAKNEGEKLASNLASEGLVVGVWSTDTDNYVLGTPLMITGFDNYDKDKNQLISVVHLPTILNSIGKDHKWLIDLCIMCGCDFNNNMPNVGIARSWDLMMKYESIEEIAKNENTRPIEILNHERCREIFSIEKSGYLNSSKELMFDNEKFIMYSRDVSQQYNLTNQYEQLIQSTKKLIPINLISKKVSRLVIN